MMRRNLIVAFKPIKNNSVILSELNHRIMMLNDNRNSCLNLVNNNIDYYCSWMPYGNHSIRDTEIGINSAVAEAIGLSEGSIVSCKVVEELPILDMVYVTTNNQKDWEMLEASSYRIQNTLLDQTRIVNEGKKLIVWINNAISICLKIEKLHPETKYGKIERNTEIVVEPFKEPTPKVNGKNQKQLENNETIAISNKQSNQNQSSLYERLYKKDAAKDRKTSPIPQTMIGNVIDSRTLDNVSKKSTDDEDSSSESEPSVYNENLQNISNDSETMAQPKNESFSKKPKIKFDVQTRLFDAMLCELRKSLDRKMYKFRAIPKKWNDSQMCDVFLTKYNTPDEFDPRKIYVMSCESMNENEERAMKEYYVNIKMVSETAETSKNIHRSIEINDVLLAQMKIPKFTRITLSTKKTVLNFIEKIELILTSNSETYNKQEVLDDFKKLLIKCSRSSPLLINQEQIFKLCEESVFVIVKIYPETFRYCLCDAEILRENKLFISEQRKDITHILTLADDISCQKYMDRSEEIKFFVNLNENENIIENCVENIIKMNCLNAENRLRKSKNYLIIGSQTSGKSTICAKIIEKLERPPYNLYVEIFNCAQNKARKAESIQKDLRIILTRCVERSPSVLLLDNLDSLVKSVTSDHSQNSDYYNQVSDIVKYMIATYTENCSIFVIATVTNINNLNQRLYTSRGNHLFGKMYKIPELTKENRKTIIQELCKNSNLKCQNNLNFDKLANLSEGYTIGYFLQFLDRATFYAFRNDNLNPILTNDVFLESLKTTNTYCLQGIENNISESFEDTNTTDNQFPGLEDVLSVFEEVLVWPSKYPNVFGKSPLRNQAGVLLYGEPGTGKTFIVSQIARHWNLRMISVKGPELLAKFIGQSEENVRNLFDKARNAKPCVLFFDEFDSIAPRRGHDSTGVTDRVVNQLLTELDGVEELRGVIVVAATSRPDLLDPALLRSGRIDRLVQCKLPQCTARLDIFKFIAQSSSLKLASDVNFEHFCDGKTENYTGADIKSILVSANMIAVKEFIDKYSDNISEDIYINQKHLIEAFKNTKPTLNNAEKKKYNSIYARFLNQEDMSRAIISGQQRATLA
ncbi:peroxisome biogenesis factor 1 [Contarinia nasturtii]|uniref:peroxisome biogenesis factor 1 n=1 Tax=Contarinia nasturtii TaxID=265458 RepID=UPI0012D37CC6|nr:peroxisome biogenesis factor 1 [Contarinia nasturtii]